MSSKRLFFKVEMADVKGGRFKGWSRSEYGVWLALKAHEDYDSHDCFPSYKTIRECSGLSNRSITEGISGLVKRGEIKRTTGKHGRTCNYYEFVAWDD